MAFHWLMAAGMLALWGMFWLALSNPAHWSQLMRRDPPRGLLHPRGLRVLAGACLSLSLMACLRADLPSIAILVWCMLLTFTAWLVSMLLAWQGWRR